MTQDQKNHENDAAAELEEEVAVLEEEVEILEEIIDLEEWAKADKKPRRAKRYRIRIDKEYKVVEVHSMTGRQILALVEKTPETYLLSQKFRGGRVEPIKADQVVEFHRHQIERFQTLALDFDRGLMDMRRVFQLAEEDEECLAALGRPWESVIENKVKWLIFPDYLVPAGYNHRAAAAAIRIPPSYPDVEIDMVYFHPALALVSGKSIAQLSMCALDGKQYQQWSRHRKPGEWRPGLDNVCTHLLLVNTWLERELKK